ncbi:unnamed protein product [Effrenium voratum]|nr:unnamed protein product [Effrenium voratum]
MAAMAAIHLPLQPRMAVLSARPAADWQCKASYVARGPAELVRPCAAAFLMLRLQRRRHTSCAQEAEKPQQPDAPDGVIDEVEYLFANSKEDEEEAMSEDVLQRVNMVTRAHQGLYKVPQGVPDTEHGVGAITGALTAFPTEHVFQVVGKTPSDSEREEFLLQVRGAVQAYTEELSEEAMSVQRRMGGRYTSVRVCQTVQLPQQIPAVLGALKRLPQVVMCF